MLASASISSFLSSLYLSILVCNLLLGINPSKLHLFGPFLTVDTVPHFLLFFVVARDTPDSRLASQLRPTLINKLALTHQMSR